MLVGIAFAIFWGTVFPVISEWVRGVKITVGPPFFNKVNAPLGLALLFLTGVGPVIAWRRATPRNLRRSFAVPLALGFAAGVALFVAGAPPLLRGGVLLARGFVLGDHRHGVLARRCARARRSWASRRGTALARLVGKNRRRYGGYVIHVGIVMVFVGIAASSAFRIEEQQHAQRRRAGSGRPLHAPLRRA